MFPKRIIGTIGSFLLMGAIAGLTYAFTGPTYGPNSVTSSSGSLLDQIMGWDFDPQTDSLSHTREALDSIDGLGDYDSYHTLPDDGKIVFTMSYIVSANMGGVSGAHALCQDEADRFGLPGTYKAWIASDSTDDPESTHTHHSVPYYLRCPACVRGWIMLASDWDDLVDSSLITMPKNTLDGVLYSGVMFTNVDADGTAYSDTDNCDDWTNNTTGTVRGGNTSYVTGWWTSSIGTYYCNGTNYRIYCFEQ